MRSWQCFYQFDLSSASIFVTANSLQCVSTQPATVVMRLFWYAYMKFMHTRRMDPIIRTTLIPTGYHWQALLTNAVLGVGHCIYATKKI